MPHVYGTYPEDVWRARYDQINDFERELAASGCAILKIFLVVSQEEQKKHFLGRLDDPTKFWNSASPLIPTSAPIIRSSQNFTRNREMRQKVQGADR